jgi:hypothetical protein
MSEQFQILEQIERGEINVAEGTRRLEALACAVDDPATWAPLLSTPAPRPAMVKWLWHTALWAGAALMAGGGYLLVTYYTQDVGLPQAVWGWVCSILGAAGVLVGWWLQRAFWLSVQVHEAGRYRINLAFPLPLGLAGGTLRLLKPFVPQIAETGADELILAMRDELRTDSPLVVEVNEEDGAHVRVYLG